MTRLCWDKAAPDFSYAMLSGGSQTTLQKMFTCAILSQEYYDNIEKDFLLCSVVWSLHEEENLWQCSVDHAGMTLHMNIL